MAHLFATGPHGLSKLGGDLRRALGERLTKATGEQFQVVAVASYSELRRLVLEGVAAIAWLPPAPLVDALDEGDARLLVQTVRRTGSTYNSALFVRAESDIRLPEQIPGSSIAWVAPESCAGALFPRLALRDMGIDSSARMGRQCYLGSHSAVARAVHSGAVDVGATFVHLDEGGQMIAAGWNAVCDFEEMRPVLLSGPVPSDGVVASKSAPMGLGNAVRDTLLSIGEGDADRSLLGELFGAEAFQLANSDAYDDVRRARASLENP